MKIIEGGLYIEVIGGGAKGEAIIIKLPSGHWGVVDCYSVSLRDPDKHAIIQRLKQLNVPELEFVALTHPHDDHYRGMSLLLEEYPPKRFWQFTGTTTSFMEFLIQYLPAESESGYSGSSSTSTDDLIRTYEIVSERARNHDIRRDFVCGICQLINMEVDIDGGKIPLKITSFAPNGTIVSAYETELAKCFDPGRVLESLTDLPLDHNQLSLGLVIEFGKCRVILGGDVVKATWELAMKGDPMNPQDLAAAAVKVSHHGSTTGYCDGLWSKIVAGSTPVAVITPYYSRLPQTEALEHIRSHASSVVLTGLSSSAKARLDGVTLRNMFPPDVVEHLNVDAVSLSPLTSGRCSMCLDHLGSILDIEFAGGAGYLA